MEVLFDIVAGIVGLFLMIFGGCSFELAGEKPKEAVWYRWAGMACIVAGALLWVSIR